MLYLDMKSVKDKYLDTYIIKTFNRFSKYIYMITFMACILCIP